MFGSSMAAFLAAFWLLASMLLNIDTTSNLFHAPLTLFMLATSYFLWSYSQVCKDAAQERVSMQAKLDTARKDAAQEHVSMQTEMQAELDAATKDAAQERVSMQAELDTARKDAAQERVSMQAKLDTARKDAAQEHVSMQTELRKESEDLRAELEKTKAERDSMQTELRKESEDLRAELEKTELDKLRWQYLANDTKNTLKHERASMQALASTLKHEEETRKVNSLLVLEEPFLKSGCVFSDGTSRVSRCEV